MIPQELLHKLITIRKTLHANPEVSCHEFETQKRIIDFLSRESKAQISKVGGTGVMATFDGVDSGQVIMIRGDIDALPIEETNEFAHRSTVKGASHKCGHDGHTAILLGLASVLSQEPIKKGKVILLFQPAEENGMGAAAVMEDDIFKKEHIDFVFALHNLPGYEMNQIVVRENEFNANVKSIIIQLHGKTSHAAEPEKGHNPAMAIADILLYADQITLNEPEADDFFLITPVYMEMGELAYGISAGYGEVHLTIRSWSTALMEAKCKELETFVATVCKKHGLQLETSWTQIFYANINHPLAVEKIRSAIQTNQLKSYDRTFPFKWGEDFGLFTQKFKGAMFGVGAGLTTPALHNPDYDFPDEIIPVSIQMFHSIIQQTL